MLFTRDYIKFVAESPKNGFLISAGIKYTGKALKIEMWGSYERIRTYKYKLLPVESQDHKGQQAIIYMNMR